MYIISIDVGIKNLAYCLFKTMDNKCEIIEWDIVSLLLENNNTCDAIIKKTKQKCGKKAAFQKNNNFFCKTHAKQQPFIIPSPEINMTLLKRDKLFKIKEFADKYEIKYPEHLTKTNLLSEIDKYLSVNLFESISKKNCNSIDIISLGKNIIPTLNPILEKYPIDCVLIENQISPLANRMKCLQGMITQYFIMKNITNIFFISSINKLKQFVKSKKRRTYKERKKLGISITYDLLENNILFDNWKEYFKINKKKDDLADAFLQGIWYIQTNNLSTIDSTLKNL